MRAALILLLAGGAFLAGCSKAEAADDGTTAAYKACMDRSGGVTVEMHDCDTAELERQDLKLNAVYKARMAALPTSRRIALRDSERAWLKATKARCDRAADGEGGTMVPLIINECWIEATIARTRWLEKYR